MAKPTLLIDGDILLYRNTVAVEREVRWDAENHVLYSNENDAWAGMRRSIERWEERFEPGRMIFCLTEPPNFRTKIDPTYKSNRADQRKPIAYTAAKEKLKELYETMAMPGLEADDVMGILATKAPANTIIVSMDKDMRGVPCVLFNEKEVLKVDQYDADYFHLFQTLIGDASDGYPGCPGIGPARAEQLMPKRDKDNMPYTVGEWWSRVVGAYTKAGLTEDDALKQARLARILRVSDWDSEKKEPILWTP